MKAAISVSNPWEMRTVAVSKCRGSMLWRTWPTRFRWGGSFEGWLGRKWATEIGQFGLYSIPAFFQSKWILGYGGPQRIHPTSFNSGEKEPHLVESSNLDSLRRCDVIATNAVFEACYPWIWTREVPWLKCHKGRNNFVTQESKESFELTFESSRLWSWYPIAIQHLCYAILASSEAIHY